jgi:HD-like signal output (HDOD) protein
MITLDADYFANSPHLSEEDRDSAVIIASMNLTIPSQPELLRQLEAAILENPDISVNRLAAIVKRDSGVASRIFQLCNSVATELLGRIDTVEDAILCMGVNQILNIARSVAIEQMLGGTSSAAGFSAFWERSQAIAQMAATTTVQKNIGIGFDEAYLVGLFHDCGVAILMKALDGRYHEKLISNEMVDWTRITEVDKELEIDHALVGYVTAHYWNLPEYICYAIRHHHTPPPKVGKARTLIALLQLSTHLHNRMLLGVDSPQWENERDTVLEALCITGDELRQYI